MTDETITREDDAEPGTAIAVAEFNATETALAELRTQFEAAVFDVSTPKGLTEARKAVATCRGLRVALGKACDELNAPLLRDQRRNNAEQKRITALIQALEMPIKAQVAKAEAEAEAKRAAKEREREADRAAEQLKLDAIRDRPLALLDATVEVLAQAIVEVRDFDVLDFPASTQDYASAVKERALDALVKMHTRRIEADREAAQAAQDRAERQRLQRIADEAGAAQRAAREAEDAERRKADEQRQREDAERRDKEAREREAARVAADATAIRDATLIEAAAGCVTMCRDMGLADRIEVRKLAAALLREPEPKAKPKRSAKK